MSEIVNEIMIVWSPFQERFVQVPCLNVIDEVVGLA